MTEDQVVESIRIAAQAGGMPPPATPEAVIEAERVIGFRTPPLLRRLYLEVANGGFGPGRGALGVRGGNWDGGNFMHIAEIYEHGPDPSGQIPPGMVLLYDWGCTIWSMTDFRDPSGPMWCTHQGDLWPQGITLAEWITETAAGSLTVHTITASQPGFQVRSGPGL
ncbi:SMI1/KNR4 family protein [Streptomyces sp. DSM 118148]|uniref:SMI1/KNR4 family protein n=1 Tax=Streptomyces sp. DSM 118148 TaxID=3448667 RepID=UPI00403FF742